jgi:hypothetical protein
MARSQRMWREVAMRRFAPYLAAQYPGMQATLVLVTEPRSRKGAEDCTPNGADVQIPIEMLRGFRLLADAVTFVAMHPEHETLFAAYVRYLRSTDVEGSGQQDGPIPMTFAAFANISGSEFQSALTEPHAVSLRNNIESDAFAVAVAQKIGLIATCKVQSADEFAFDIIEATQPPAALGHWSSFAMFLIFDAPRRPDENGANPIDPLHCRAAFFYRHEERLSEHRVESLAGDARGPAWRPLGPRVFSSADHCPT